jgi:DNA polymerase-3 subunit gamma/tau
VAGDVLESWRAVLDRLKPSAKAIFREARPDLQDGVLVLHFRYAWHFKNAPAHQPELMPLLCAWLGADAKLQFVEDAETAVAAPPSRPSSPEDHPLVQAAVKTLEGKVTRVREV